MPNPGAIVRMTIQNGEPTTIGDVTVTLRSRTFVVRLPFGGFVWNRPIGVTVRRGEDVEELPIRDWTRVIQIVCAGVLVALLLASRIIYNSKKEIPR
jgi:hypothetical protein